jgi:CBS domain containing-hemolysin-like protein
MMLAPILVVLSLLLMFVSYVDRIYTEMGKFLSREFQENIEVFEQRIEPRLHVSRDRASLAMAVLAQLTTVGIALIIGWSVFHNPWTKGELAQAVVGIVLIVIIFRHLLPFLFFSRTKGEWAVGFTPVIRALVYMALPITIIVSFCLSVAALTKEYSEPEPERQSEAVDALIEAGQEEGILEESDRALIQSVVEFGDKTVREVMTPRPSMVAVPTTMTVEQLTELLRQKPYSRLPVYQDSLDNIVGMVFAHDVLQVRDSEAHTRTVDTLMRTEVNFVPETKLVSELLREMRTEHIRMAIVIDEYGGVSGLVTIEDMVEEIVGEIRDEHEAKSDIVREKEGTYIVPGNMDVDRLDELFGVRPEDREATTVAGLVSELMGRIPRAGEVVEDDGLRFEVLQSTDRKIERLRISTRQAQKSTA